VVYTQLKVISAENNTEYLLYCSLVTDWTTRDCSKAKAVCTTPGPIFYVEQNKTIDVAWVYDIQNSTGKLSQPLSSRCYTPLAAQMAQAGNPDPRCVAMNKKIGKESCTYLSPT
jgi:hypothetical protein